MTTKGSTRQRTPDVRVTTGSPRSPQPSGAAHTPGPWRIGSGGWPRLDGGVTECVYEEKTCWPVALAWSRGESYARPDKENRANAHLIAAAPELLEACRAIVSTQMLSSPVEDLKAYITASELVVAAIRKAEGRS